MANEIKNKQLWRRLSNVTQKDWIKAAQTLGLLIVYSTSGTSHYINFRDPAFPDADFIQGFITTVTPNCYRQANEHVFKSILKYGKNIGIFEDDIWRALKLL